MRYIKQVIGGIPVDAPGYTPGDGFEERPCEHCEKVKLWVGPKSLELKASDPEHIAVLCPRCVVTHLPKPVIEHIQMLDRNANSKLDKQVLADAIAKGWRP